MASRYPPGVSDADFDQLDPCEHGEDGYCEKCEEYDQAMAHEAAEQRAELRRELMYD